MKTLHDSFFSAEPDSGDSWIIGEDGGLDRQQIWANVAELGSRLPPRRFCVILADRTANFIIAFLAAVTCGQTVLLPPNSKRYTICELLGIYPDSCVVADSSLVFDPGVEVVEVDFSNSVPGRASQPDISLPSIDPNHIAAIIFTSGSTGLPTAHYKIWKDLCLGSQALGRRLGISDSDYLVSTVPPQHMFGFEMSVLLPLTSGCRIYADVPFYPADILGVLERQPRLATLATTPIHLRALTGSRREFPPMQGVISSTSPLSPELAKDVEKACHAPLHEIYGSTETGALATRRTTETENWRLLNGIQVEPIEVSGKPAHRVVAPHLPHHPVINDHLEVAGDEFLLLGRGSELVKVGGKRSSLTFLNQLLLSAPGVKDGIFVFDDDGKVNQRLYAVLVAPGAKPGPILDYLRERVDPVFLPRPIYFVDHLPRNKVGKIPREDLQTLISDLA